MGITRVVAIESGDLLPEERLHLNWGPGLFLSGNWVNCPLRLIQSNMILNMARIPSKYIRMPWALRMIAFCFMMTCLLQEEQPWPLSNCLRILISGKYMYVLLLSLTFCMAASAYPPFRSLFTDSFLIRKE